MKLHGTIQNGRLTMQPEQKRLKEQFLATLKDATLVSVEIKKFHPSKTQKQLAAYWGLFSKTVLAEFENNGIDNSTVYHLDKPTGNEINKDELKWWMYAVNPIFRDGKRITMRDYTTEEMVIFFEKCRNFMASQFGIYVPDPNPNWRDKTE